MTFQGKATLTLVVNVNVIICVITISNSAYIRAGGCSNVHPANLSHGPASAFRVATLLEDVFMVEIVHANLLVYPLDRVKEVCREVLASSPFFQLIEARGVKRTACAMGWS